MLPCVCENVCMCMCSIVFMCVCVGVCMWVYVCVVMCVCVCMWGCVCSTFYPQEVTGYLEPQGWNRSSDQPHTQTELSSSSVGTYRNCKGFLYLFVLRGGPSPCFPGPVAMKGTDGGVGQRGLWAGEETPLTSCRLMDLGSGGGWGGSHMSLPLA